MTTSVIIKNILIININNNLIIIINIINIEIKNIDLTKSYYIIDI